LEREILEIKMKLQGSSIGPSYEAQQLRNEHEYNPSGTLTQSIRSAGMHRSHGVGLGTGTY